MPRHSHGVSLHRSTDGTTYSAVADIVDINPPGKSRTKVVTTPHSETEETSIPGRIVVDGNVTLTLNFDADNETSHVSLEADFNSGDTRHWRVETPQGVRSAFEAWVLRFDVQSPEDDRVTAEVELCVTGGAAKSKVVAAAYGSAGAPDVGTAFTVVLSTTDGIDNVEYQWQKQNSGQSSWNDIAGATSASYTPTNAVGRSDVGDRLRVQIEYDDLIAGTTDVEIITPRTAAVTA